jgi:hypothetical protein
MNLIKTPQELLLQKANILPHLAEGGEPSTQDMQAELIVNGHTPAKFIFNDVSDEDIGKLIRHVFSDTALPNADLIRKLLGPLIHDLVKPTK